jgi:hypothetical protein
MRPILGIVDFKFVFVLQQIHQAESFDKPAFSANPISTSIFIYVYM